MGDTTVDPARHVLARDDLREFHFGFTTDPPLQRHAVGWSDSLALTHCVCFAAAAKAVEPLLRMLAEARNELNRWGWGDHHYGDQQQEQSVVSVVAAIDALLGPALVTTTCCLWCGEPTESDGRQVVETRLGVGTVVKGRLCPSCSADAGDIDEAGRC